MSYVGSTLKMMQVNRTHILSGELRPQSIGMNEYAMLRRCVEVLGSAGERLRMSGAHRAAIRAIEALDDNFSERGIYGAEALGRLISPLEQALASFVDGASEIAVFGLYGPRRRLLDNDTKPLGPRVAAVFPKIQNDFEEAGACLALERSTACVFHLMRAMEAAVQASAERLGISKLEREWGKLLSDMARSIEAMPKGHERDGWSENHSLLYHVKQAWRNDVMHPGRAYSIDEAGRVHDAVTSYLQQLAELLTKYPPP